MRIASEKDENEESEEKMIEFEEDCLEMFDERSFEDGFQFYFSQYEGLIIKSCQLMYRRWIPLLCLCLISFIIEYSLRNSSNVDEILLDMHNYSSLPHQTIFFPDLSEDQQAEKFNPFYHSFSKKYPHLTLKLLNQSNNALTPLEQIRGESFSSRNR